MKIPYTINPGRHRALELLLTRHSPWPLVCPVPSDEELALVFAAALRAADHGRLQPWRFVLVREESLPALGDALVCAAQAAGYDIDPDRARAKVTVAPMAIAVIACINPDRGIPGYEQLLSASAAAMNMLNALHFMGYGGFWKSPPGGPRGPLGDVLGLGPNEPLVGMLYVGAPKQRDTQPQRSEPEGFIQRSPANRSTPPLACRWQGP